MPHIDPHLRCFTQFPDSPFIRCDLDWPPVGQIGPEDTSQRVFLEPEGPGGPRGRETPSGAGFVRTVHYSPAEYYQELEAAGATEDELPYVWDEPCQ